MNFKLSHLPCAKAALKPVISERTMEFHYEKHHRGSVEKLNKLVDGTAISKLSLEEIMAKTYRMADSAAVFDNAAQVWNHDFFLRSMTPMGGGRPLTRRWRGGSSIWPNGECDFARLRDAALKVLHLEA